MRNIFARSARNELKFLPVDVAADKTLSALSPNIPTSTPGNRKNYPTGFTGLRRISLSSEKRS